MSTANKNYPLIKETDSNGQPLNAYDQLVTESNNFRIAVDTDINELEQSVQETDNKVSSLESKTEGTTWTDRNHGAGSGLDADKLDGLHAEQFVTKTDLEPKNITNLFSGTGISEISAYVYGRVVMLKFKANVKDSWGSLSLKIPAQYKPLTETALSTKINSLADRDKQVTGLLQPSGNIATVANGASGSAITFSCTYICQG